MAENRFAKYLTPPDVGPTYEAEDPIVKRAPVVKPDKPDKPNLPTGYEMGPDGTAHRIPGLPPEKGSEPDKPENPAYSQSALDAFDRAIATAGRLKTHPGFNAGIGMPSINPLDGNIASYIVPGSNAADFRAELDALKAQVFLPMVQSMKGMGALSNAEGEKLTAAIGALDPKMSEAGFSASLDRVMADLKSYRDRGAGPQIKSGRTGKAYTFDVPEGADDAAILAAAKAALQQSEPDTTEAPVMAKRLKYNPATGELE